MDITTRFKLEVNGINILLLEIRFSRKTKWLATWCHPQNSEKQLLEKMQKDYIDAKRFAVCPEDIATTKAKAMKHFEELRKAAPLMKFEKILQPAEV